MSTLAIEKEPDWLDRAARDAAHELEPACLARNGANKASWRHHSIKCERATRIITKHMRAAVALARKHD